DLRSDQTVPGLPAISPARLTQSECGVADHLHHAQFAEALSISSRQRLTERHQGSAAQRTEPSRRASHTIPATPVAQPPAPTLIPDKLHAARVRRIRSSLCSAASFAVRSLRS